jgi:hypothetical protein
MYSLLLDMEGQLHRYWVGWYDASDPAFARLHVFDASGKDVGDFVTLGETVVVK